MPKKKKKGNSERLAILGRSILFFLLPLVVLAWTSLPGISEFTLHVALIALLARIGLAFVKNEKWLLARVSLTTLVILLLVGGTGWFLSPFFFLLYLLPVYLGFLYQPLVSFTLLTALLIIFASSVGEVNLSYDIMILLSLLLVVPLVIYLRKQYLIIRQTRKDILILEEEGIHDLDTISKLLANRVTNMGVSMRQPLTFIKQAATLLLQENNLDPREATEQIKRIRTTATEALEQVRDFEKKTSANVVLTTRESAENSEQEQTT